MSRPPCGFFLFLSLFEIQWVDSFFIRWKRRRPTPKFFQRLRGFVCVWVWKRATVWQKHARCCRCVCTLSLSCCVHSLRLRALYVSACRDAFAHLADISEARWCNTPSPYKTSKPVNQANWLDVWTGRRQTSQQTEPLLRRFAQFTVFCLWTLWGFRLIKTLAFRSRLKAAFEWFNDAWKDETRGRPAEKRIESARQAACWGTRRRGREGFGAAKVKKNKKTKKKALVMRRRPTNVSDLWEL